MPLGKFHPVAVKPARTAEDGKNGATDCSHVADVAAEGSRVNADSYLSRRKPGGIQTLPARESVRMAVLMQSHIHMIRTFLIPGKHHPRIQVFRLSQRSLGTCQSRPRSAQQFLIRLA